MTKKQPPQPPPDPPPGDKPKKRPPSRERVRYVAVPLHIYHLLERFAEEHSDQDQTRSISWAARRILRRGFEAEGYDTAPPPPDPPKE